MMRGDLSLIKKHPKKWGIIPHLWCKKFYRFCGWLFCVFGEWAVFGLDSGEVMVPVRRLRRCGAL